MKTLPKLACLLPLLAGMLHAEVPRKPLPSKYRNLWQNSPFTTKPQGPTVVDYNVLQDYVLLGVSPIEEGYRVTMLNRKRPNDGRVVVESNRHSDGFKIVEVMHSQGEPLKTKVKLAKGGKSGTVGFEDKFLALKAPPATAKPQQPNNRVLPGTTNRNQPSDVRVPRRRIIPPTSGGGQQGQKRNPPSRGVPGTSTR